MLGFIILRHVNSKSTDLYWKECYKCIRKFYDNPILIIDDSSNPVYLLETFPLKNCTIIYDKDHKGAGELLPYYYFHKLKPFDTAVILHDSVFIKTRINFEENFDNTIRFLWSFEHTWDDAMLETISDLITPLPHSDELVSLFHKKNEWKGCFGVMSVIHWNFLTTINERHALFETLLPKITSRDHRKALERIVALLAYYNTSTMKNEYFGNIHSYIRWGTTFSDYKSRSYINYPIIKVWTGR
jgi:hypothetical protein